MLQRCLASSLTSFVYSLNVGKPGDADGLLELGDGVRVPHVVFAVATPLIEAAVLQHFAVDPDRRKAVAMPLQAFAGDDVQPDAVDARGGAGEILLDQLLAQADGFEDLRAAVALHRGDAHLRRDFDDRPCWPP